MNCGKHKDRIPLLILGDLEPAEREELEKHLQDCAMCRAELGKIREVARMLTPSDSEDLTDLEKLRLENQIYRKLALEATRDRGSEKRIWSTRMFVRVAAAVAIFFLGYGAGPLVTMLGEGEQPTAQVAEAPFDMTKYRQVVASGLRFSPEGLRIIARGRSALITE